MRFKKLISKLSTTAPWKWPQIALLRLTSPLPSGLWLINVIVQRFFRVNSSYPWMIHFSSRVVGTVNIGKNVWISFAVSGGCYIQGVNEIWIGDDTIFAPGVKIISANHDLEGDGWVKSDPIRIGHKCWLGTNSVVLPGVSLGDGCVVGAGSVVTKSFPAWSIVAGVPAGCIGMAPKKHNSDRQALPE